MDCNQFMGYIPSDQYYDVIKRTQIVSVDLLIHVNGRYLLGKRKNRPAQGLYFVPGGKVYNNETILQGVQRVLRDEIGLDLYAQDCQLRGVYEHVYPDNYRDDLCGTHYIVFAYDIKTSDNVNAECLMDQHTDFEWMTPNEIKSNPLVHQYNKYYFEHQPPNQVA